MGRDSRFNIPREVGIDGRRGIGGEKSDALGNLAAHGFRCVDDGNWLRVTLDDHLSATLHSLHDRPYIFGQVSLTDVQYLRLHTWDHSASGSSLSLPVFVRNPDLADQNKIVDG
jgi:hypothetical protein